MGLYILYSLYIFSFCSCTQLYHELYIHSCTVSSGLRSYFSLERRPSSLVCASSRGSCRARDLSVSHTDSCTVSRHHYSKRTTHTLDASSYVRLRIGATVLVNAPGRRFFCSAFAPCSMLTSQPPAPMHSMPTRAVRWSDMSVVAGLWACGMWALDEQARRVDHD